MRSIASDLELEVTTLRGGVAEFVKPGDKNRLVLDQLTFGGKIESKDATNLPVPATTPLQHSG